MIAVSFDVAGELVLAVLYIVALTIMRNLPTKVKRSRILYVGMATIMGAFISFMLLERNAYDYLIVDTLMPGVCGIFDLFWWSILGEMLDHQITQITRQSYLALDFPPMCQVFFAEVSWEWL